MEPTERISTEADKMDFEFTVGGWELLDEIEPLWSELNRHHIESSTHFAATYEHMIFQERRKVIDRRPPGTKLRVELVMLKDGKVYVAYCVTSLAPDGAGEIESIYVDNGFRCLGLGSKLMRDAIKWLDEQGARKKRLWVASGNEQAFHFYERHGFQIRRTELEQTKPP